MTSVDIFVRMIPGMNVIWMLYNAIKSEGQANVVQECKKIKPNGVCVIICNIDKPTKWFLGHVKQVIGPS